MSSDIQKVPAGLLNSLQTVLSPKKLLAALPAASALKTKKAGIIALASIVAMALGITAISNRKSIQSSVSSLYKKVEAKAKAAQKSVSEFVKKNPNAAKVTAAVAGATGLLVGGKLAQKASRAYSWNNAVKAHVKNEILNIRRDRWSAVLDGKIDVAAKAVQAAGISTDGGICTLTGSA